MEISNGYCPDCYYMRPQGSMSVGRGEHEYQHTIRKPVDMILNEQGFYECPYCHLQTVWVDKYYPFLWILKTRGTGRFRDSTHPELYSDVGGKNKQYLGGFEFFITALPSKRWETDSGESIPHGSWWGNYVEFLLAGKSKDYSKNLTYSEIMSEIKEQLKEPPEKTLERITLPIAVELSSPRLIKLYLESEVEAMPQESKEGTTSTHDAL